MLFVQKYLIKIKFIEREQAMFKKFSRWIKDNIHDKIKLVLCRTLFKYILCPLFGFILSIILLIIFLMLSIPVILIGIVGIIILIIVSSILVIFGGWKILYEIICYLFDCKDDNHNDLKFFK